MERAQNLMTKKSRKVISIKNKKLFKIDDIDVDKILISKKEPYGTNKSIKYFVGYNDDDVIRQLCIKLPQTIICAKFFKDNNDNNGKKTMTFNVNDEKLLKKYIKILKQN